MKTLFAFSFLSLMLMASCQDDLSAEQQKIKVTYEVVTTAGDWFGAYTVETGEKVCICQPPWGVSGWRHSFEVPYLPFELHIDASAECCSGQTGSPDVTTNIYVNDRLVTTNTSNWAPGVASADYIVE